MGRRVRPHSVPAALEGNLLTQWPDGWQWHQFKLKEGYEDDRTVVETQFNYGQIEYQYYTVRGLAFWVVADLETHVKGCTIW